MRLKLGSWAAGADGNAEGTIQWAGGPTDFSKGPFNMYVQSVAITNYNPASSYEFTDRTGSWQSIRINGGSSSGSSSSGSSSEGTASTAPGSASTMTTSVGSTRVTNTTVTTAPTSRASVVAIDQNTAAAVSVTSTGSSYSMNSASVSAQNTVTAVVIATGATETSGANHTSGPSPAGGGNNGTYSGTASASQPQQTDSGASSIGLVATGSLLSFGIGLWLM